MLMPMLWSNNDIFDEMDNFFNDGFFGGQCRTPREARPFESSTGLMRTDVIEKDNCYQLEAELRCPLPQPQYLQHRRCGNALHGI